MGGSVYAFAGGKGGVGKTTTTANVGLALQRDFDVAVVDADVGLTNLGALFDREPARGVHHVLAGEADVEDVLVEGPNGLGIVPGESDMLASGRADPANLSDVVDPLRTRFDLVLLDTGAGVNHQNFVAYGLADAIALVTTPDEVAVADTAKTVELVERVDGTVLGVVVTRADADSAVGAVGDRLDTDVLAAVPPYEDPDAAEPRLAHDLDCPASAEFERLSTALAVCHKTGSVRDAAEAVSRDEDPDEESDDEASGGFFCRLGFR